MKNYFYFYGGGIGSFFLALFLIENIRLNFGNESAKFYIVVPTQKNICEELGVCYPYIKIIQLNRKNFFYRIFALLPKIFSENYAMMAPSFGKGKNNVKLAAKIITLLNPRSRLIGFNDGARLSQIIYNKVISQNFEKNIFQTIKEMLFALDLKDLKANPDFKFIHDESVLHRYSLTANKYLIIHPFAANPKRSLPPERWSSLIKYLLRNHSGYKIILIGGPKDSLKAKEIVEDLNHSLVINISGKTTLQEEANLIHHALGYIGVDTGITHLASLVGKNSVVFGNLSNPCWLPHYNPNAKILTNSQNCSCQKDKSGDCSIVHNGASYFRCLFDIPQEEIEIAASSLFH